ncbi:hypothetical protein RSAG8_01427, partial [Rhizoctonia solani AG-8 WAC10335]
MEVHCAMAMAVSSTPTEISQRSRSHSPEIPDLAIWV